VKRQDYLAPLLAGHPGRLERDQLEILTALISGPSFGPVYRGAIITIPGAHPVYRWVCVVAACERPRSGGSDLCSVHMRDWAGQNEQGIGKAAFVAAAQGLDRRVGAEEIVCRICVKRPAAHAGTRLCETHLCRWGNHRELTGENDEGFADWVSRERPCPGYGTCAAAVCPNLAESPLGLCPWHSGRYRRDGSPGTAMLADQWWRSGREGDLVSYADQVAFRRWCTAVPAQPWPGQINLRGLRPLARAEIQWGMFAHARRARPTRWDVGGIRSLAESCRTLDAGSLLDAGPDAASFPKQARRIAKEIMHELRLVYFTPEQARDAGFLETEHFGVLFPQRMSHFDLTGIPQRWLRDLTWDHLAGVLRSPSRPRSAGPFDDIRRAAVELGAFLEVDAPGGGHDPAAPAA
jgi:hypothetical protein